MASTVRQLHSHLSDVNTDRLDIIYRLYQARDPDTGEAYSEGEMMFETTLLGAGSDTANSALTAIFYFLAQNPQIMVRLTGETRRTFADFGSISYSQTLHSMEYLRA